MSTFLTVVGGVLVGLSIAAWLAWLWLKQKLGELGGLMSSLASLPPFRIRLLPSAAAPWRNLARVDRVAAGFAAVGYECAGDFEIPEMEGVAVRGFRHDPASVLAAVYDVEPAGVFVDLMLDLLDGTRLTLTTAPEDGLDRPPGICRVRIDVDLDDPDAPRQLHARLLMESRGREPMLLDSSFEHAFVDAYTREMDWRIRRGGVTAAEIRREARLGGQEEPSDQAIELIRASWRSAIDALVEEEVRRAWLSRHAMSLEDWERDRDRFVVVHAYSSPDDHIEALAWLIVEGTVPEDDDEALERAFEAAKRRLRPAFEGVSPRDGFEAAQRMLPEKRRYEQLARLDEPWPADCYLHPAPLRSDF